MKQPDCQWCAIAFIAILAIGASIIEHQNIASKAPVTINTGARSSQKSGNAYHNKTDSEKPSAIKGQSVTSHEQHHSDKRDDLNWPEWIQAGSAFVTVLLTGGLIFVASKQIRITNEQNRIAERQRIIAANEFRWTHRPRIKVRMFRPDLNTFYPDNRYNAEFIYVNVGETPAFILEIGVRISCGVGPWTYGAKKVHFDDVRSPNIIMKSGERNTLTTQSTRFTMLDADHEKLPPDCFWWCTGYITYQGIDETEKPDGAKRNIGFCRRWNYEGMTFERHDDEEWEYDD